ncbi:MAG TPA: glutathione S-transferase family protein, partial [Stenotrophobium sp.]|nr:glutathione S-transferase family protein [Stenotrophobium sp.]
YRKIPVAQIGADIFCDSRTIAAEIAALSGKPLLALENCDAEIRRYVESVDLEIFFACLMASGSRTLGRKMWQSLSFFDLIRFIGDRIDIGRKATVKMMRYGEARPRVLAHLAATEARLQRQDFLFGPHPSHADFSTYHSLWFMRTLAESSLIDGFPRVMQWLDRVQAFGHGHRREIPAEQALEIARTAVPRAIPDRDRADPLQGRGVQIAPSDYGQVPTRGTLAGSTSSTWILARTTDSGAATVHVHFPKSGYSLVPV